MPDTEHGRLSGDGIECACQSPPGVPQTLTCSRSGIWAVFATASLRNISNTAQAVEQIFRATGIPVEVLSGEAEAEYGFQGATCDIRIADGLFADVGGASAEPGALWRRTGPVAASAGGILEAYRVREKILPQGVPAGIEGPSGPPEGDDLRDFPRRAHLVCVGGTARASLRLCRRLFGLPEDSRTFTRSHLEALDRQLRGTGKDTADLILRCEPERIHTLVPGVMVLRFLAERYGVEDITVSHYGVREGYLRRKIQPSVQA